VDDYQAEAQRIISVLGRERTQLGLDWLKESAAGGGDDSQALEEHRIADALVLVGQIVDAIRRIANEERPGEYLDGATRTAMSEHLTVAIRRELDST
jgi:hypothetical protein